MKIGIDARPLQGETRHRGIGKTLENMISAIRQIDKLNSYVFYIDSEETLPNVLKVINKNESIIKVNSHALRRAKYIRSVVKSFKPVKVTKKQVDIFYEPDASLGVPKNVPSIVMFYDLIPLIFREDEKRRAKTSAQKYKSQLANEMYWSKYKKDLNQYKYAQRIVSISQASKDDLIANRMDIDTEKVSVLHLGANTTSYVQKDNEAIKKLNPYLLYVGGIDYRKNIRGLLEDFFTLKPNFPELKLVLIGKEFGLKKQLDDLGWSALMEKNKRWKDDIIIPGFVSDEDLAAYYKNAVAFVFPSIYEGFGLPVLEAMAMQSPVIAYKTSSIPEIAGSAAMLVKPGESLAPYIHKLLVDEKLRNEMIQKGLRHVKKFSWQNTAKNFISIMNEVYEETK